MTTSVDAPDNDSMTVVRAVLSAAVAAALLTNDGTGIRSGVTLGPQSYIIDCVRFLQFISVKARVLVLVYT